MESPDVNKVSSHITKVEEREHDMECSEERRVKMESNGCTEHQN